jgi:hypothetical protein
MTTTGAGSCDVVVGSTEETWELSTLVEGITFLEEDGVGEEDFLAGEGHGTGGIEGEGRCWGILVSWVDGTLLHEGLDGRLSTEGDNVDIAVTLDPSESVHVERKRTVDQFRSRPGFSLVDWDGEEGLESTGGTGRSITGRVIVSVLFIITGGGLLIVASGLFIITSGILFINIFLLIIINIFLIFLFIVTLLGGLGGTTRGDSGSGLFGSDGINVGSGRAYLISTVMGWTSKNGSNRESKESENREANHCS